MSADIVKVREWEDAEGHRYEIDNDPDSGWAWPAPPKYVESRVEGALRDAILAKLGREDATDCTVRIVEGEIEGGWSEFTVEVDYDIEVWIDEERQSQRVWRTDAWTAESTLAAFLNWAAPTDEAAAAGEGGRS